MTKKSDDIVITSALRTPIGKYNGNLGSYKSYDLGSIVIKNLLLKSKIPASDIDEVILGQVLTGNTGQNPARQAAINGGIPINKTAYIINQVCGSGLRSIASAYQSLKVKDANIIIAGGQESMTNCDKNVMLNDGLIDVYNKYHMGVTAENVAIKWNISREDQDKFAIDSQGKAKKAMRTGVFKPEIVPVELKKGVFDTDEHPREVSMAALSRLKPVFTSEGTVTAGNASGINDGAAAMIVSSEEKAKELGLKPVGEVISYAVSGVEPSVMGIGPVPAMNKALAKAGLTIDDIDLVELNEAFAVQSLAVLSDFPIPSEKLNVNGGAVALGHPIGASGSILIVKLLHEMQRRNAKRGLVSLCVGGGQGIAMVIENPNA